MYLNNWEMYLLVLSECSVKCKAS